MQTSDDHLRDFTYLGYANGWRYTHKPEEVITCEKQDHPLVIEETGRCLTRVTCPICKYYYHIDSSD
jgi:ssDNA-binding Zn-finger/Zn-ribbon topoisomerase 1